jgi:hypothetical protein
LSIQDSDWEEIQNGDSSIPHDMIYSASVPSNAKPSVEHLNAMAKVFDEDDDGSYDDDLAKADSLNEVKLSDFLTNIFVKLWESDRLLFEYLCQVTLLCCFLSLSLKTNVKWLFYFHYQ